MRIGPLAGVVAVLALGGSDTPRVAAAEPIACEALARVPLAGGTIVSAESVRAGGFTPPTAPNASAAGTFRTLPAFCRVTARLTPTPDSDIRIEVWLPQSGWNRKVQPRIENVVATMYSALGIDWSKEVHNLPSGRTYVYVDSLGANSLIPTDELSSIYGS